MILVTGGAGYIGSHVVKDLLTAGHDVVVLDNLSTGHRASIKALKRMIQGKDTGELEFVLGDVREKFLLTYLFKAKGISSVIHLAASSSVQESMEKPELYLNNNVLGIFNLLECMASCGVKNIVFSSSAAVYGNPIQTKITEDHPRIPVNVYGTTKVMAEDILAWYGALRGVRYMVLRYFNAAGADESGGIGEWHIPETHLIPAVMEKVREGKHPVIFGYDYPTPDGTCVRDYVHVTDLAQAHVLALKALEGGMKSNVFNLGNGNGYSVMEVLDTIAEVIGEHHIYDVKERRAGDPAILVADSTKIKEKLGWSPAYPELKQIVETAWKWEKGAKTIWRNE